MEIKKLYSKEVMEHFTRPKNVGQMKDFDGLGKVGNPICGDVLWLYLKMGKDKKGREVIQKATFSTFGCTVAIANSSLITTLAKGKTIKEALKIKKDDLLKKLKGVPPAKIHCSLLAADALSEAIYDYLEKNKKQVPESLKERHEKIYKEKQLIEERYKSWIGMEEKISKNIGKKRK